MLLDNKKIVERLELTFKLNESPIAFFYTDNPPQKIYKPKPKALKNVPCIIQLLNGVRRGRTLVLGKKSRNLCMGGLAYLGFKKRMPGLEYYLSTGIPDKNGNVAIEGERFVKTPHLAKNLYSKVPFQKSPADYAVFMPLHEVNLETYEPLLIIFFVKMDQLAGLIQLAHFDTMSKSIVGMSSGCGTIITEPLEELKNNKDPRPVIGMLTDILSRRHIRSDEATFTIGYNRLLKIYENIDESFLTLESWERIQKRI